MASHTYTLCRETFDPEYDYQEYDLEVEVRYYPEEPPSRDREYPGCGEEIEISSITCNGEPFEVTAEELSNIESEILAEIRSDTGLDDFDGYEPEYDYMDFPY